MDDPSYSEAIGRWAERVRKDAKQWSMDAESEPQFIDCAGTLRGIESALQQTRLGISVEFDTEPTGTTTVKGTTFKATVPRTGQWSYNDQAILASAAADGFMVRDLIMAGAMRISWTWTKLQKFFMANDIELRQVGHELTDDDLDIDGPHVGLWYKTGSVSYSPVDDEG